MVAAADAACPAAKGKDYTGQDLSDKNFSAFAPGSLVGANFSKAILKGANFANLDLSGANFQGAILGSSAKGNDTDFTNATLKNTCFIKASGMGGADFTYANIDCADFSHTLLSPAQFGPMPNIAHNPTCRTKFIGSLIDVHAISLDHWGYVDFTNTNFQGLSRSTFSLAGKDISGAMLGGIDFSNIDMTGANLTKVDFSHAILTHAKLTSATLNGAKLILAHAPYVQLDCAQFYGGPGQANTCGNAAAGACKIKPPTSSAPTAHADLTQANLQTASMRNTILDSAILTGANLSGVSAAHASFRNASLEAAGSINTAGVQGADLSGANFQNAHLNFVHLDSTTLAGACFDQRSTLSGTTFNGAIMPGANFDSAVLEGISFNAAILENAVFTDATMKTNPNGGSAVDFNCAQLGGSSFANATVTAANFEAAVMPPAQACCPQPGGGAWCGTVDYNDKAYGAVTYPILKANVTCPNGDVAACSATQWLIPDWQTKLCNSRQAVETVWTKPDCGSTPGNTVKFKDQNLKSCILAMLPGHPSSITVSRAATLREVSCPEREISDLTGLENFTGLSRLDLTGNQIGQFNLPLKQLQKLNLSDNQLKSLDVSHLANLLELDVAHNQLQSIVGLVAINPEVLDLSYNQLAGFDLPVFDNLVIADLSHNVLTDVLSKFQHNLNALQSLRYLDLSHNSLATIGDAKQLANQDTPVTLYLECNPTFDCHSLDLTGDQVTLQKSACALFNSQSGKWLEQPHPTCLTSANLFGSKH